MAVQRPAAQTCMPEQVAPHAPQCRGSEAVAKQPPSQSVVPEGQRTTHARFAHTVPGAQTAPHAPQLNESLSRSTQPDAPSQVVHGRGDGPVHPAAAPRTKPVTSGKRNDDEERTVAMRVTRKWSTRTRARLAWA